MGVFVICGSAAGFFFSPPGWILGKVHVLSKLFSLFCFFSSVFFFFTPNEMSSSSTFLTL